MLSAIMKKEREIFLRTIPEESANGFYSRTLQLAIGKLDLKIPRIRSATGFRPALLPEKWKRVDKDYENLLLSFLTNGYSQSQIEKALHSLGLPYSQDAIDELVSLIHERSEFYRASALPDTVFAVFIDAYHTRMRAENNQVKEISIYTALGIDMDGFKSVLGFWVAEGSESRAFWADVFQDLISRGLKRVLLFVTDDFAGVGSLISKLYPLSDHQLCYIHMQRNLRRNLSKNTYHAIKPYIYSAKEGITKKDGLAHFSKACDIIEKEDRRYADMLRQKAENYLAFLDYPADVRRHIYTTNAIESINAGLEYIRHELGGYFPSRRSLDVNYFVQIANRNDSWMRNPVAMVRARGYELRQILAMRFEVPEEIDA
jgi:transposase-like protein